MRIAPVVQSFEQFGYPVSLAFGIGILELVCIVVYVIPRTSILGALSLTGYLGGVLIWRGLFLREERLRAVIPLRS